MLDEFLGGGGESSEAVLNRVLWVIVVTLSKWRASEMVDMAERRKNWSREETLAALFLYLALPARLIDDKGEDVQTLASAIGRTPAAVSLKM